MADLPPIPVIPVICDRCRAEGLAGDDAFAGIAEILDFEPVPRRAHADGWRPELQRAFVAALAITGAAPRAARAIGKHAFGAEQLRKARGGRSFAAAWDAALEIYREREMARLKDNLDELAKAESQREPARPFGGDDDEDEDEEQRQILETRVRIRDRLLRARRLLLLAIRDNPAKRSAWETLVGPVDRDKAERIERQEDEPEEFNMRRPDMLLCAEVGLLPDLTGGPSIAEQMLRALRDVKAEIEAGNYPRRRRRRRSRSARAGRRRREAEPVLSSVEGPLPGKRARRPVLSLVEGPASLRPIGRQD